MTTDRYQNLNVVALGGGAAGAAITGGLAHWIAPRNLFVVANTANDFEHLGLSISPDVDALMYALAGVSDPETGHGRAGETWRTLDALAELNGPTWVKLGDKGLAVHLLRTHWLRGGYPLSWVTGQLCRRLGIEQTVMPMTDSPVRAILHTGQEKLNLHEYSLRRGGQPAVQRLEFEGAESAASNRDILNALRMADVIVLAFGNPLIHLDPVLALPGLRRLIAAAQGIKIALSPALQEGDGGGATPTARLMRHLGLETSAFGVANHLRDVLDAIVLRPGDDVHRERIAGLGVRPHLAGAASGIPSPPNPAALARQLLDAALAPSP